MIIPTLPLKRATRLVTIQTQTPQSILMHSPNEIQRTSKSILNMRTPITRIRRVIIGDSEILNRVHDGADGTGNHMRGSRPASCGPQVGVAERGEEFGSAFFVHGAILGCFIVVTGLFWRLVAGGAVVIVFGVFGETFGERVDEQVEVDSEVLKGLSLAGLDGEGEVLLSWGGGDGDVGDEWLGEDEVGGEAREVEGVIEGTGGFDHLEEAL